MYVAPRAADSFCDLAGSALPHAPVVDDGPTRLGHLRHYAAARLRAFARGTYSLADRVDAVRCRVSQPTG